MSIPQPLEKLDAEAFLPADGQERAKQVTPSLTEHNPETPPKHAFEWAELLRIVFVALAAAAVWCRVWEPFPRLSVIGILATLIGEYPIFKEAFENIVERKMTMELSMTIALLSALAIGEFFTALVINAFVLAAEVVEGLTVGRGRRAIHDLRDFLPEPSQANAITQWLKYPRKIFN
jgi:cation transport ATPase